MKKIIIYIFSLCAYATAFISQNAKSDFAKVSSNLASSELLVTTEYRLFSNYYSKTPAEVSYGILKQTDGKIFQQISSLRALITDKISLHIDTLERILVVSDPVNLKEQKQEALKLDLEQSLSTCKSIVYHQINKTTIMYEMEYKDDVETEFDRCELYINTQTFLPAKIIFYYNEPMSLDEDNKASKPETPRLEIAFTNIDVHPKLSGSDFDEKKFIQHKGNKIVACSPYRNFKVVDNRYNSK